MFSNLKSNFPGVPLIALTATATPHVQKDICQVLCSVFIDYFSKECTGYVTSMVGNPAFVESWISFETGINHISGKKPDNRVKKYNRMNEKKRIPEKNLITGNKPVIRENCRSGRIKEFSRQFRVFCIYLING